MALPKLASAKYELTLPSNGEKVEFRPFLVKEEKLLLMAQGAGTEADQIRAIKDIVYNCTFNICKVNFNLYFCFFVIWTSNRNLCCFSYRLSTQLQKDVFQIKERNF